MSSLMQHHGTVKQGKVELLMYLVHDVEIPARCMWCGVHYDLEKKLHVCSCGRAITHLFIHTVAKDWGEETKAIELAKDWGEETKAIELANESSTCYVANSWTTADSEPMKFEQPNGKIYICPKLYRIWRTPVGMLGCWVQFRWGGKVHSPDLSVPISVHKLPGDARPLTTKEATRYWFTERKY